VDECGAAGVFPGAGVVNRGWARWRRILQLARGRFSRNHEPFLREVTAGGNNSRSMMISLLGLNLVRAFDLSGWTGGNKLPSDPDRLGSVSGKFLWGNNGEFMKKASKFISK
jgi:hypothetical protein